MPAAIASLYSTGVGDNLGHVLADGAVDGHYAIIAAPSPDTTGPANVVLQNNFPLGNYWLTDDMLSKWIAPHANENDFNGGVTEPVGTYTYRTTFSLSGYDPATATITGRYSCDNTLIKVLLNGVDVGIASTSQTDYFGFHSFTIRGASGLFQDGLNTLDFVVSNIPQADPSDNAHNPSGLRVEMTGTANLTVTGTLTADNHYGLYFGSSDGSNLTFVGRNEVGAAGNPGNYNWSLPETWTFAPATGDYIYVAVWDDGGPQMWTGQFDLPGGVSLVSDTTHWQYTVAPGANPGENGAVPALSDVMSTIAGATWATPQAAAANGTGPWGTIPGLSPDAQFVWHDTLDAHSASDGHYVIFRTAAPVSPTNSPPSAANDFAFTNENTPVTIHTADLLANDSDDDGDTLQVVSVTPTSANGGSVVLNNNSVIYTPAVNYFGVDSFQYTIRDSFGWSDTATVFVNVNSIDGVAATVTADNHYGLYFGSGDGSALTLVGRNETGFAGNPGAYNWSLPESYKFNIAAGNYLYVLAWNDGGPAMWTGQFDLPNGVGLVSDLTHWQYTVASGPNPGSDGALPALSDVMNAIGTASWATPTASAPNGSAPWGSIPGLSADAQFVWHDTLNAGSSSDGHYVIFRTATPVDQVMRIVNPGDQNNAEGDDVLLPVVAGKASAAPLTYSAANLPAGLSIDASTGLISGTIAYSAAETSDGTYAATVTATDGTSSLSQSFTWTVSETNRLGPLADQRNVEGDNVVLPIQNLDPSASGFVYSAAGLPPGLSIDANTGTITGTLPYTAAETNGGQYTFTVSVTVNGDTDSRQVNWSVTDTNRLYRPDDQASREGQPVSVQLQTIPNSGSLTFSAVGLPDGLTIDAGTGVIRGAVSSVAGGTTSDTLVTVSATGDGATDSQTFTWTTLRGDTPVVLFAVHNTLRTDDDVIIFDPSAATQTAVPVLVTLYDPTPGLHYGHLDLSSKGVLAQTDFQLYDGQSVTVMLTPVAPSDAPGDVLLVAHVDGSLVDRRLFLTFANAAAEEPSAQQIAISGVKAVTVKDLAGPDVTDWFARDIVDQIEFRAKQQQDHFKAFGFTPQALEMLAVSDQLKFREQAKYLMAPKWVDFGGPNEGKGVHTVVVANRGIRKNQLGNIEFGTISQILPPSSKALQRPIRTAYFGIPFYPPDAVATYWKKHPYHANFGKFEGVSRADNLAAFGVGHGIADSIQALMLGGQSLKKVLNSRVFEKDPILSDAERAKLIADVKTIIQDLFADKPAGSLARRVNKYTIYLEEKTGLTDLRIPVDALFFIPEYGGFNTDSLTPTKGKPYEGKTSREYFQTVLSPAYDAYVKKEKDASRKPLDKDEWLTLYNENYAVFAQKQ